MQLPQTSPPPQKKPRQSLKGFIYIFFNIKYMYESVHDIFDAILPIPMHKWIESDVSGRSMARDQVDACTA